ncbi:MAG: Rne/Rng family ribonuclease [SAR324 cluster bacterium]|nr:Rne/Rng family ribonuclease [SAR324 cluster bacterium]
MSEMSKKMFVNVEDDETRIASTNNSNLEYLYIEHTHHAQLAGNIYCGTVVKVQTSFQAAFIDYGAERHGFLPASDINPRLFKSSRPTRGRPSIDHLLKPGQTVLVQVVKDEIAHKGATLTTNISLPGRFMVFMPNTSKGGVSKKIDDPEQRSRLKHLLEGLASEEGAAIVRTAGVDRSLNELKQDFLSLRRKWIQIQHKFSSSTKPCQLYQEDDAVVRMLRDYFTDDIDEIWIDDPEAFQRSLEFFKINIPNKQKKLHLYLGERSLFDAYSIEEQIEKLSLNEVPLISGGSLVIDPTEALVAVDVNSGKSNQERSIEETALRTNLEAAEEIARQLRLRNLGGLIVIDFIDMDHETNRNKVIAKLEESLANDKAKWTVGKISQFGLLEMSRQRIASSLTYNWKRLCPTCQGTGYILSTLSQANAFIRKIREIIVDRTVREIRCQVPLEISIHLLNTKRKQLYQMEFEFDTRIVIIPNPALSIGEIPDFDISYRENIAENGDIETKDKTKDKEKKDRYRRNPRRRNVKEREDEPVSEIDEIRQEVIAFNRGDKSEDANVTQPDSQEKIESSVHPDYDVTANVVQNEYAVHDENDIPEMPQNATSIEESPNTKTSLTTHPGLLFSSVHEDGPRYVRPVKVNAWKEYVRTFSPGTLIFSSSHRFEKADVSDDKPASSEETFLETQTDSLVENVDSVNRNISENNNPILSIDSETTDGSTENETALNVESEILDEQHEVAENLEEESHKVEKPNKGRTSSKKNNTKTVASKNIAKKVGKSGSGASKTSPRKKKTEATETGAEEISADPAS